MYDRLAEPNAEHDAVNTKIDYASALNREMGFNMCKIQMLTLLSKNTQLQINPMLYASVLGSLAGLSYKK
jgi:uncharacterized membrane protein